MLGKFYFGDANLSASKFLESNQGLEISKKIQKSALISEKEKEMIRQYIANFQNWAKNASLYLKANTLEVILLIIIFYEKFFLPLSKN